MLKLKLTINDNYVEEVKIENVGGNLNGVCTYKVSTTKEGEVGTLKHDRRDGAYKLVIKVFEMLDFKDNYEDFE